MLINFATQSTLHCGIIMDGNGRWARRAGCRGSAGHRAGVEAVRPRRRGGAALGIGILTLYAFSSDNWRRPAAEVGALMRLLAALPRASGRCVARACASR